MDPLSLIPAGGVGTTLVVVIVYLMRQNHADRQQYAEAARSVATQHAADMAAVRAEITALKEANARVLAELDSERKRRWHAEDLAATYRRQLGITEVGHD